MSLWFSFVVGTILGSFYNVAGLRLPKGEPIFFARSRCSGCRRALSWHELVPVVSFFLLQGRCRKCGCKLSWLYPFVEAATGCLFSLIVFVFHSDGSVLFGLLVVSLLAIVFVSDLTYMIIPNRVLLVFLLIFVSSKSFGLLSAAFPLSWTGALTGFLVPMAAAWLSSGKIGGGDVKLLTLLGFMLGLPGVLTTLFFACLSGLLYSCVRIGIGWMKNDEPIAFGPFIALGAVICLFCGKPLLSLYFSLYERF
ncbi:MAG TPA: prepilin peptidase [Bacillales bacterium]|nr:prepilin peptidase [Bacillales bacterium]